MAAQKTQRSLLLHLCLYLATAVSLTDSYSPGQMNPSVISPRLKMVAAGRGKTMCMEPMVDAVLRMVEPKGGGDGGNGDETFNMVYLGTAVFDRDEPFQAQTHAYQKLSNCRIVRLNVSEAVDDADMPTVGDMQKIIDESDAIFVSGGNTLSAMERWKNIGLDRILTQAAYRPHRTPVLCGGSAGAIVWFSHGHSDSMDPMTLYRPDPNLTEEQKKDWKYIRVEGLRIVDADVLCVPHYDATQSNGRPRSEDSDEMLMNDCNINFVSIGIDEAAAIAIENGRIRAISGEGDAHLHVIQTNGQGQIQHKHVRPQDGKQSWEDFVSFGTCAHNAQEIK